jgi:hypothetical protein
MMIDIVNKKWYRGVGVYIGRPSILGNPYSSKPSTTAIYQVDSNPDAVKYYRQYLWRELQKDTSPLKNEIYRLAGMYQKIDHLTLVCWCKEKINDDIPCHGDVIRSAILYIIEKDFRYENSS